MAREKASGSRGKSQGRAASREERGRAASREERRRTDSRENRGRGEARGRAASREMTWERTGENSRDNSKARSRGAAKGMAGGSLAGPKKKEVKLNPDKLSKATARAKKMAEAARMADEFAYAVRAAGMFGASASETAAELEAMSAQRAAEEAAAAVQAEAAERAKVAERAPAAAEAAERTAEEIAAETAEPTVIETEAEPAEPATAEATTEADEITEAKTEATTAETAAPVAETTAETATTAATEATATAAPIAETTATPEAEEAEAASASEPQVPTFQELGLNSYIVKAISEMGFERPTPVQARIIPTLLAEEGDIVCLAQTGTGKTAAFGLPSLERIVAHNMERYPQVLVLSPTRELCRQISQDLKNYSKYLNDLCIVDVYGGAGIEMQIKALKKIPHIVVATPGRLLDLIGRKAVDLSQVHTLILDEADEMLNMGFKEELDAILESIPQQKRVLLFSATLPLEVEKIAKTYMNDAQVVTVGERNSGSDNVKHYYYTVHEKDRYLALKRVVDYYPDIYGIIFCRTRRECGDVSAALIKDGYDADALHGDLSQMQRDQVMRRFREKSLRLLVATDVAARGIDVNNLTHVINYNLPDEVEQYTHRSGRTGRADKTGKSIVIINTKEQSKIRRIEKIINKTFAQSKLPTGDEVCSKQLLAMIDQINAVEVREDDIAPYLSLIEDKWRNLGRHEIIKKFLSVEFNRFLDYYRNAPDLNIVVEKKKKKGEEAAEADAPDYVPRRGEKGFKWVKLSVGSKQNITTRHLIRMMTSLGVGKKGIGKIEIRRNESFVNITASTARYVVNQTNNSEYRGKRLFTEIVG